MDDRVIVRLPNATDGSEVTQAPIGVGQTFTCSYTASNIGPFLHTRTCTGNRHKRGWAAFPRRPQSVHHRDLLTGRVALGLVVVFTARRF